MSTDMDQLEFTQNLMKAFDKAAVADYKKGHILTGEGSVENHLFLIENGAVKISYQSELNEHIIRLGYNGSILNSLTSFFSQTPSELIIETLRQTKVKVLNRSDVMQIAANSSGYPTFLERLICQQLDRELDLLQDSAGKRLERVLKRSPQLFQHVPLKYIAAYLRMSHETLSRIRKS